MMTSALMPSQSRTKRYVTAAVRVTGVRAAAGKAAVRRTSRHTPALTTARRGKATAKQEGARQKTTVRSNRFPHLVPIDRSQELIVAAHEKSRINDIGRCRLSELS
jgi:hypothetical protein